jgi:alpha-tubulin suppressor-like RCC1 family protein
MRRYRGFTGVRKLDGGGLHTCAVRTDGTVWCWGLNTYGSLGVGTTDDDPHPFPRKVDFA